MTTQPKVSQPLAVAMVDAEGGPLGFVVTDSPERLWAELQRALERRPATSVGPADFAAAMRRVEDEVYNAI